MLPFELKTLDEVPSPTNPSIHIKTVPQRTVAVNRFTGAYSQIYFKSKTKELFSTLVKEKMLADQYCRNTVDEAMQDIPEVL